MTHSPESPNVLPLKVHGLNLSYFTGKLEAYLRAKGIAYELVEMDSSSFNRCARITGVAQMPQLEFPDGRWLTDSTQIIEHFERELPEVAIYPSDPALNFIAHLLEDFGDEWLWRPAMYYRWHFAADARQLSERLARGFMRDLPLPLSWRRLMIQARQRHLFLRNDGVTRHTAPVVEALYLEVLDALQGVLKDQPFMLGQRPSQADMGFFGSMFRHFACDPTGARIMRERAPAVLEWVARLWNLQPRSFQQSPMPSTLPSAIAPLLAMVCSDYLPYLERNQQALAAGQSKLTWQSKGVTFTTPSSPYRNWCWQQLRSRYQALHEDTRTQVKSWLIDGAPASGTQAAQLLDASIDKTLPTAKPDVKKPLNSHWN